VDTQEQHDRDSVIGLAFNFGEGLEPLAGEAFRHERHEADNPRLPAELLVAGGEELLNRLDAEHAVELVLKADGRGPQRVSLVRGEVFEARHLVSFVQAASPSSCGTTTASAGMSG
jgi:hypothetical protein